VAYSTDVDGCPSESELKENLFADTPYRSISCGFFVSGVGSRSSSFSAVLSEGHFHDNQPHGHLSTEQQIRRCSPDSHLSLAAALYLDVLRAG